MADAYTLPRDAPESARLDEQHQIWKATVAYPSLLHPRIIESITGKQAHIADVATGTGAWLLDLAAMPEHARHTYTGLDISSAQFPATYPSNVSFGVLNIFDPLPAEYHSSFDVVHVRLLVLGLAGEQWHTTARNLLAMLKPGGYLQWEEADFAHPTHVLAVLQPHGRMMDEATQLPEICRQAGFEELEERVVGSDAVEEWRERFMRIGIKAFAGILKIAGLEEAKRVKVVAEAETAVDEGNWGKTDFHIVVGRKKA
ncbi:hypothetical protein B0A48_01170 [Cryoendolithus antarcticus]|uniref:Methyltransferase domain-containing protein n=1 Tax=Cryoendolithus antarcticus TaxID=1507870 RepID=A0A1V8TSJ5_9PEZI|nr:hypothetical protein B0A48_01170 [Cryoendolithus antarcticus]